MMPRCIPGVEGEADIGTSAHLTNLHDTDGSEIGVGAVLHVAAYRVVVRSACVVAYGSRTLSKAERKYNVTRKEFAKYFRPYLLERHFVLRTDHSALQWIYSMKE